MTDLTINQASESDAIEHAANVLLAGHLVAFPTETVYGLGADAENPDAIKRIYQAKGRPLDHPIIVHVAPDVDLNHWASDVPPQAYLLIEAFWPGPLTLILPRQHSVPAQVSGGQATIGLRCPSHPIAQALIRALASRKPSGQAGVAAPSANLFGHVSPTLAEHVRAEFGELIQNGLPVLEGGASEVGIESTIVDLSRVQAGQGVYLLRPGSIGLAELERVLGEPVYGRDEHAPRVSGSLRAHYAPHTPISLVAADKLLACCLDWLKKHPEMQVVAVSHEKNLPMAQAHDTPMQAIKYIQLSAHPKAYAHDLYATLRAVDLMNAAHIFWAMPPQGADWLGIQDRLARAAAAFEDS